MTKIFRVLLGVFSFRDAEIAQLELEQKMDDQNYQPLCPPEMETRRGLLWLRQVGIRERDLEDNHTTGYG